MLLGLSPTRAVVRIVAEYTYIDCGGEATSVVFWFIDKPNTKSWHPTQKYKAEEYWYHDKHGIRAQKVEGTNPHEWRVSPPFSLALARNYKIDVEGRAFQGFNTKWGNRALCTDQNGNAKTDHIGRMYQQTAAPFKTYNWGMNANGKLKRKSNGKLFNRLDCV